MSKFPRIVCLCGSTRFWREFQRASLSETMAGKIVLSIGAASGTDDEHFGNLPREEYDRVKTMLDELHKRKIDLADEVLILNVGGYIGESTRSELDYAIAHGKPVRFLEETGPSAACPTVAPPRRWGRWVAAAWHVVIFAAIAYLCHAALFDFEAGKRQGLLVCLVGVWTIHWRLTWVERKQGR